LARIAPFTVTFGGGVIDRFFAPGSDQERREREACPRIRRLQLSVPCHGFAVAFCANGSALARRAIERRAP
jgi:hypothetical protein